MIDRKARNVVILAGVAECVMNAMVRSEQVPQPSGAPAERDRHPRTP